MEINIDLEKLEQANLSDSLKMGFKNLEPELPLNVDPYNIVNHPRIQHCIKLLKAGLEKLPFHGYGSLESINKILSEHFLDRENVYFNQCFKQLSEIRNTAQLYSGIGKVGHILDEYKLGGSKMIRAACLARSKKVNENEIRQEINEAIEKFYEICRIQNKLDLIESKKEKWILKKTILPSYYHLQLLAYTQSWRSNDNLNLINQGLSNLVYLNIPQVYLKYKSQIIAPANLNFYLIKNPSNDLEYFTWFDLTKLLLKAGFKSKTFLLSLNNFIGSFEIEMLRNNYHFTRWGAYSGLALEPDWCSKVRKKFDILYRIIEIKTLIRAI